MNAYDQINATFEMGSKTTTEGMIQYVAGFLFDSDFTRVALIRKSHPGWMKGKLNGVGGRIDATDAVEGDSNKQVARRAMVREFREEAGIDSEADDWYPYVALDGEDLDGRPFRVWFLYATFLDVSGLASVPRAGTKLPWVQVGMIVRRAIGDVDRNPPYRVISLRDGRGNPTPTLKLVDGVYDRINGNKFPIYLYEPLETLMSTWILDEDFREEKATSTAGDTVPHEVRTGTDPDEPVDVYQVSDIDTLPTLPNVPWLIRVVTSFSKGERASFFRITEHK